MSLLKHTENYLLMCADIEAYFQVGRIWISHSRNQTLIRTITVLFARVVEKKN